MPGLAGQALEQLWLWPLSPPSTQDPRSAKDSSRRRRLARLAASPQLASIPAYEHHSFPKSARSVPPHSRGRGLPTRPTKHGKRSHIPLSPPRVQVPLGSRPVACGVDPASGGCTVREALVTYGSNLLCGFNVGALNRSQLALRQRGGPWKLFHIRFPSC